MSKMQLGKEEKRLLQFVTKVPSGTKVDIEDIKKIVPQHTHNKAIYHVNHFCAMAPNVDMRKGILRDGNDWYIVDITKDTIDDLKFGNTPKNHRVRNYYKSFGAPPQNNVPIQHFQDFELVLKNKENDEQNESKEEARTLIQSLCTSRDFMISQGALDDNMVNQIDSCIEDLIKNHMDVAMEMVREAARQMNSK